MPDQYTRALAAADHIRSLHAGQPTLGIILGSGLGGFAAQVEDATTIAYEDIPGWPLSTVEGHSGKLVLGTIGGVHVAVMQGRVHAYEGYSMAEVTFPTRVLGLLGCAGLIVTNAYQSDWDECCSRRKRAALWAARGDGAALLRYERGLLRAAARGRQGRSCTPGNHAARGCIPRRARPQL